MATNGQSASLGAVSGARTAYEIHSTTNPETQRKYAPSGVTGRKRSASNLRPTPAMVSSSRKGISDGGRSASYKNGELVSSDVRSRAGPELSHAQDLYGQKSTVNLEPAEHYDDIPENMYRPDKEDLAGWIHREKLAKIENEELQAAGINLAKARSKSKDALGGRTRDTSRDRRDLGSGTRDERKLKMSSPVNEAPDEATEQAGWDLRTPEEIASDNAAAQLYASPLLRKSGSKIPVMTSSPTPIPPDRYERETPMPRKRTMSGSLTPEDSLSIARSRNGQLGDADTPESQNGSPTKQRSKSVGAKVAHASSDAKSSSGIRKLSISNKAPAVPNTSDGRPPTRGNDAERPRTAVNAPEGDPPWLASMYKPDPRLPPDQQLIPTLAKKQQQQIWEANGDVPSTYDKNFSPLKIYDADGRPHQPSTEPDHKSETAEQPDAWPLKPIPPSKYMINNQRPPTSSGTGGYSTMPKVTDPPVAVASSPVLRASSPASLRAQTPLGSRTNSVPKVQSTTGAPSRLQQQPLSAEEEEKVQKKKGCCCVVM